MRRGELRKIIGGEFIDLVVRVSRAYPDLIELQQQDQSGQYVDWVSERPGEVEALTIACVCPDRYHHRIGDCCLICGNDERASGAHLPINPDLTDADRVVEEAAALGDPVCILALALHGRLAVTSLNDNGVNMNRPADSLYRGEREFDREQLIFMVECILIGALDRIEDGGVFPSGVLEVAGMTMGVIFAQLTGAGLGVYDALILAGNVHEAVLARPGHPVNTRHHAEEFVRRAFESV